MTPPNTFVRSRPSTWSMMAICLGMILLMICLITSSISAGLAAMVLTVVSGVFMVRFVLWCRRTGTSWLTEPFPLMIQLYSLAATLSWMAYALWTHAMFLLWINIVSFVISSVSLYMAFSSRAQVAEQAVKNEAPER